MFNNRKTEGAPISAVSSEGDKSTFVHPHTREPLTPVITKSTHPLIPLSISSLL